MYYYHHPAEIPAKPPTRRGFFNPFELVIAGRTERQKTGIIPDREELAKRLNRQWVEDLNYLDELIEQARPEPPPAS